MVAQINAENATGDIPSVSITIFSNNHLHQVYLDMLKLS